MTESLSPHDALALLDWQIELGADEAIGDDPVNRFEVEVAPKPKPARPAQADAPPPVTAEPEIDAVAIARSMAEAAPDLPALKAALEAFDHCPLKETARNLVFSDGNPAARVMIVGEAPGKEEDVQGKPFVGRAGQLLDRMFAAIGLNRMSDEAASALYITNMLPWRPPQNRDPSPEEMAMLGPFARRHIELVNPDLVVLMGNFACQGMLGKRGITRLRGQWDEVLGRPAMPMFHPAYLLRRPHDKAKAWADLLEIQARLKSR